MHLVQILNQFKQDYSKLIRDFSVIDENDPLTPFKLNYLTETLNNWVAILEESFSKHHLLLENLAKQNQAAYNKYCQEINGLSEALNKKIKQITQDTITACNNLQEKIKESKQVNDYTIEQFEQDYNFFYATSLQNKLVLDSDFEEAKKRYDYEREEARDAYLDIVRKNNLILNSIKEALVTDYTASSLAFDEENKSLIRQLNTLIESKTKELNSLISALENERNNMKEKYRQESALLNGNIKKISEDKNIIIDKARSQYNKALNDSNIEKENKRQDYQVKSQALLRDFVTKISVIDEQTTHERKLLEDQTLKLKRDYYSMVYTKTKVFHNQLEKIYTSSTSTELDKYTNRLIKFKNKQYALDIYFLKKENELKLEAITKNHTINLQQNRNNVNFLEIDKNYAIKNLTDEEQFDNKYYQEKADIIENDFNYIVKTANYRFNQKANLLRCQSQIRAKLLERNYDGIEANYYKKIESIQNKINSYRLEIKLTQELGDLVKKYEKETYTNNLHREEVENLLEIEKNKLLRNYNEDKYQFNLKNIEMLKNYGYKKIDLETEKALETKNLNIKLQKLLLEKNNVSTAYAIKKEEQDERFSKVKTQIFYNNDLKLSKENYINNLNNNDIDYLTEVINSFNNFFDSFKRNFVNVVSIILKDITATLDNYHFLESLINSFLLIFLNLFSSAFTNLYDEITSIISKKLDYIYEFKFKASLDSLNTDYEESVTKIKEQKSDILDKMDSANKTIENFRQKIYTLINDNEMLLINNKQSRRKLPAVVSETIKQNDLKIKEYREKIEDYTKINKMHEDDLIELNDRMAANTSSYQNELEKIKRMQTRDSLIYIEFKNQFVAFYHKTIYAVSKLNKTTSSHVTNEKNLGKFIDSLQKKLIDLINSTKLELNNLFTEFVNENNNEAHQIKAKCSKEYQDDIHKYNRQYFKANQSYQNEYQNAIQTHEDRVNEQKLLIERTINHYDDLIAKALKDFEDDSNNVKEVFEHLTDNFYASYYALEDNNKKIIEFYHNDQQQRESNFQKDKALSVKRNTNEKKQLNEKLKTFIETKNEEIEHLPIAFKYNTRMLNKETKKKNNSLHNDIKNAKIEFIASKKHIDREIDALKVQLEVDKALNEANQHKSIIQEKHNHKNNLRIALREIKIEL